MIAARQIAFVLGADLIDYTAKDYVHFNDYAFLYDGIENVGLGKHADILPIEYDRSQWRNIAPLAKTFEYNTDLDVVKMTPTKNSMLFSTVDAWAGWGYNFNSKKINNDQVNAFLAKIFSGVAGTESPTEYTVELIFSKEGISSETTSVTAALSGYNERSLYSYWDKTKIPFWRYGYWDDNLSAAKVRFAKIEGIKDKGTYHVAFSQSYKNSTNKLYINGIQVYEKAEKATAFFLNMVALKRANYVHTGMTSGEYFGLRIAPVVFSDEEIAYNYNIDKARFGL